MSCPRSTSSAVQEVGQEYRGQRRPGARSFSKAHSGAAAGGPGRAAALVRAVRRSALTATARRRSGNPRSPRVWRAASARGLWRPTCAVRSCAAVFEAQGSHRKKPYVGVDVVRCRQQFGHAPFPLCILCPADGVEPVEPGAAAGLGLRGGCRTRARPRCSCRLGPWLDSKVSIAAMLKTDVCRWDHTPRAAAARLHAKLLLRRAASGTSCTHGAC